jgi:transposase
MGSNTEQRRPEMELRSVREVGQQRGAQDAIPKRRSRLVRLRATRDAVLRGLDDVQRVGAPGLRPLGADIRDYEYRGEREAGFIPRPLHQPTERLFAREDSSVHTLMDRIEALDREVGLPFGGSFS